MGKMRNCLLRAISPFPTVFSNDFHMRHVKTQGLFGKELKVLTINGKGKNEGGKKSEKNFQQGSLLTVQ